MNSTPSFISVNTEINAKTCRSVLHHHPRQAPHRRLGQPGDQRAAGRQFVRHLADEGQLTRAALAKQGIDGAAGQQCLVDHSGIRLEAGPRQVTLQALGLVHRCSLRQSDHQHMGIGRVLQARQQQADRIGHIALGAHHLPVIGLGGVEQQDGVAGRCGVEHHETVTPCILQPFEIGGELGQHRFQIHTAYTGGAAHRGIKHFALRHDSLQNMDRPGGG